MDKFKLYHVALYAKGWYKRFDIKGRGKNKTVFDDLRVILKLDDYDVSYWNDGDIARMLIYHFQRLNTRQAELYEVLEGIKEENCWKYGYVTERNSWNKNQPYATDYNQDEAVVWYILSSLYMTGRKDLGIDHLPFPDYKNGLPRKQGMTDKRLKEVFSPKTEVTA